MEPKVYGLGMIIEGFAETLAAYKANQQEKNAQIQELLKVIQDKNQEIEDLKKQVEDGKQAVRGESLHLSDGSGPQERH